MNPIRAITLPCGDDAFVVLHDSGSYFLLPTAVFPDVAQDFLVLALFFSITAIIYYLAGTERMTCSGTET